MFKVIAVELGMTDYHMENTVRPVRLMEEQGSRIPPSV
jgi:hypothetical protein